MVVDMQSGVSLPLRRAVVLDRVAAWRLALGGLFVTSVVVRTWAAWLRATPNYFPDEGIYATLSRALAHGHLPEVRGHVAHFPALLQPLLTAPAWWFGSLETGYRVTQAIECAAVSTAALAVWWTARHLGVGNGAAFAAAAVSLAVPDAGYSGWVLSEPFAYPLFVAAVGAGAVALGRPTRRAQSVFLAFALLAAFARLQLAVLLLAYLAAALVLRRLREQRIVIGGVALGAVAALVGGLGYYRAAPAAFHLVSPTSLGRNALVLAYAAGWAIVPAGVLGLAGAFGRSRNEEERAFGAFALIAGAAVLAEATLYGDGAVVHERYGCYLLPLLALGFALHADRGWPWGRVHALLAAALLTVAAAAPLSGWAAGGGNAHSLVLTGLLRVEALAGSPGDGALLVAAAAGALSVAAIVCAWRGATILLAVLALSFCIAASAFATAFDVQNSHNVKASFLPAGEGWMGVDATVVAGSAPRTSVLEQFFWNRGARRLALLPGAAAPDAFFSSPTRVSVGGALEGVTGRVVLDEDGAALVPTSPERANGPWLAAATPQLAAVLGGRYGDGWLAPSGHGRMYRAGTLSFTVSAPEALTLRLAGQVVHIGTHVPAHVYLCAIGPFGYAFSSHGYLGSRAVSARTSFPVWSAGATCRVPRVTVD
jgi:hypothetical protein